MKLNTRTKGNRVQRKAASYANSFPGVKVLVWRQPAWFATEQPFDVLVLRQGFWPCFVEVRANQWRVNRKSTRELAGLPGEMYHKHIWRFRNGQATPEIREWSGSAWLLKDSPWDNE